VIRKRLEIPRFARNDLYKSRAFVQKTMELVKQIGVEL
jgi:hypothetical protein